jgi:hypothetical protein
VGAGEATSLPLNGHSLAVVSFALRAVDRASHNGEAQYLLHCGGRKKVDSTDPIGVRWTSDRVTCVGSAEDPSVNVA